jgi:outer membrane lipoprotein-sorting protein
LLLTAGLVRAQSSDNADDIVRRMMAAHADAKARLRAYQATRNYQVFKGSEKKSEITAEVNYLPPQQKSFSITHSSGGTAEGVVKRALEHEVEIAKSPRDYEISPANYDFTYAGEVPCADSRCFVLTLTPKRNSKDLIKGHAWVDRDTYLIRRVEGELAKNPSWWVKKAIVQIEYGNLDGMWLQTGSIADAKLRMMGDYRLISRNVDLRTADTVASARVPNRPSFRRRVATSTVLGESGFFLPRRK